MYSVAQRVFNEQRTVRKRRTVRVFWIWFGIDVR
jgi:hypothetical protein